MIEFELIFHPRDTENFCEWGGESQARARWVYGEPIPDFHCDNGIILYFDTMEQFGKMKEELLKHDVLVKG